MQMGISLTYKSNLSEYKFMKGGCPCMSSFVEQYLSGTNSERTKISQFKGQLLDTLFHRHNKTPFAQSVSYMIV